MKPNLDSLDVSPAPEPGFERQAVLSRAEGFHIRHPPKPHLLSTELTKEEELFQTIHMGSVTVDKAKWLLVIDGLVRRPFALTYEQLLKFPSKTVTSFHECFGSPLAAPTAALWRIGNVNWTGVPLNALLSYAQPTPAAQFVWSEGLDSGVFAGVHADRYQKDLPLTKALNPEVLVAYAMNGKPLGRERGGPVRLVVPGWFGTNSTKWLCKLTLSDHRATGPYTTTFYNVQITDGANERRVPVWMVDVNSMIVRPAPDTLVQGSEVEVEGWAWSNDGVGRVDVSSNGGESWEEALLEKRTDFSWQKFSLQLRLGPGSYLLMARATAVSGESQPLSGWRNHAHGVKVEVRD